MTGDKDFIYDEDESVKFIQNYLPQELKGKFSNDDINYIVDLIYEFYESKGCMSEDIDDDTEFYESKGCMSEDIDDDTEIEIDEDELTAFVVKNAQRDGVGKFTPEEIAFIVQGEMAYCESLDMFE